MPIVTPAPPPDPVYEFRFEHSPIVTWWHRDGGSALGGVDLSGALSVEFAPIMWIGDDVGVMLIHLEGGCSVRVQGVLRSDVESVIGRWRSARGYGDPS